MPSPIYETDYRPRILIIDDQYGRRLAGGKTNLLRHSWRMNHGLADVTGDASASKANSKGAIVARAVFHSGQLPCEVEVGSDVRNDLEGTLQVVREGWLCDPKDRWACVLVDLEFLTGQVTAESSRDEAGAPEGCDSDRNPHSYFGLRLIDEIKKLFPDLPVIILSSNKRHQDTISERYETKGVKEFIDKQDSAETLKEFIWEQGLIPDEFGFNLGYSVSLLKALRDARRAAATKSFVIISGQTGTGKQPLAKYLMLWSARHGRRPQHEFNCAVLEKETGGSQLFGHVKGAFTGAASNKTGIIEAAHGGDLFLDELAQLSALHQAKLLKVIEDGMLTRLGEDEGKARKVNVRIIAGTNQNLSKLVENGKFLPDFLFRLSVFHIHLPPLVERFDDLELLVNGFIRKFDKQDRPRRIGTGLLEHLKSYSWPGNIRELSNRIEEACVRDKRAKNLLPTDISVVAHPNLLPVEANNRKQIQVRGMAVVNEDAGQPNANRVESGQSLPKTMSVPEFLEFIKAVELTADSLDDLRGIFSYMKQSGAFDEAFDRIATRLLLLALKLSVNDSDAKRGLYNHQKAVQSLVDSESAKATKFSQLVDKYATELAGPFGDELRSAVEKKKAEKKKLA